MSSIGKVWWKRPSTAVRLAAAAILLTVGWQFARVQRMTPGPSRQYHRQAAEMVRAGQPEGPDRWRSFDELASEMSSAYADLSRDTPDGWPNDAPWPPSFFSFGDGSRTPAERDAVLRLCRELDGRGFAAKLERLRQPGVFQREASADRLFDDVNPASGAAMRLAGYCRVRMIDAAARGDHAAFVVAARDMEQLARIFVLQGSWSEQRTAMLFAIASDRVVRDAIADGLLPAAACGALMELLNERLLTDPARGVERDRLAALDAVAVTHTARGDGANIPSLADKVVPPEKSWMTEMPEWLREFRTFGRPTRAQQNEWIERAAALQLAAYARPFRERRTQPWDAEMADARQPGAFWAECFASAATRDETIDMHRASTMATKAMLLLELHRAEHGAYPRTLDAAADRFAAAGIPAWFTAELVYVPGDGRTVKDGYALWWKGEDGVDDGGAVEREPVKHGIWFQRKPGHDILFGIGEREPAPASGDAGR